MKGGIWTWVIQVIYSRAFIDFIWFKLEKNGNHGYGDNNGNKHDVVK